MADYNWVVPESYKQAPTPPAPEQPWYSKLWEQGNKPLVHLTPEMERAISSSPTAQEHPYADAIAKFLLHTGLSMTSPIGLGLTAATFGEGAAEKAGLENVSKILGAPQKAAAVGMMGHGAYKAGTAQDIPTAVGGVLEGGLGLLGAGDMFDGGPAKTSTSEVTSPGGVSMKPIQEGLTTGANLEPPRPAPPRGGLRIVNEPTMTPAQREIASQPISTSKKSPVSDVDKGIAQANKIAALNRQKNATSAAAMNKAEEAADLSQTNQKPPKPVPPVDPAKVWAQEAINLNKRDEYLDNQAAIEAVARKSQGLEQQPPTVSQSVKAKTGPGTVETATTKFTPPDPDAIAADELGVDTGKPPVSPAIAGKVVGGTQTVYATPEEAIAVAKQGEGLNVVQTPKGYKVVPNEVAAGWKGARSASKPAPAVATPIEAATSPVTPTTPPEAGPGAPEPVSEPVPEATPEAALPQSLIDQLLGKISAESAPPDETGQPVYNPGGSTASVDELTAGLEPKMAQVPPEPPPEAPPATPPFPEGGAIPLRLIKSPQEEATLAGENYGDVKSGVKSGNLISPEGQAAGLVPEEARATAGRIASRLNRGSGTVSSAPVGAMSTPTPLPTPSPTPAPEPPAFDQPGYDQDLADLGSLSPEQRQNVISQIIKNEKGEVSPAALMMLGRMGLGGATGAAIGNTDEAGHHPILGAIAGAGLGAVAPSLYNPDVAGEMLNKVADAGRAGLKAVTPIQNSLLLSPLSLGKKIAGDFGGMTTAGLTDLLSGNPQRAGELLKTLFSKQGLQSAGEAGVGGWERPPTEAATGLENLLQTNKWYNPLSKIGRGMGAATAATKDVLNQSGYTPEEQGYYTMTGRPTSEAGRGLLDLQRRSKLAQFTDPFLKMGINRVERAIDYSPLGFAKAAVQADPEARNLALSRAMLGTGAMGTAAMITPENFAREHPEATSLIAATGGPLGIPIATAMALKTRSKTPLDTAAATATRDLPGIQTVEELRRPSEIPSNLLSRFTNITRPIAEAIDPEEPDIRKHWYSRAESNIPFIRGMMEKKPIPGMKPPSDSDYSYNIPKEYQ